MRKGTYYIANFPSYSMKNPLATLSGNVLLKIESVFDMFSIYADESYGNSPRRILQNLTQKNESVFISKTSYEGQSNRELLSPGKAGSSSSDLSRKQLPFLDTPKEAFESLNIETKTSSDSQESVKLHEKVDILKHSPEGDPRVIATAEELASKAEKSKENIKDLMRENRAQIKSVSIIRQSEEIKVEINIDFLGEQDTNLLKEDKQDSVSTRNSNSPSRAERKSTSPSVSASKSPGKPSSPTVDYSDPNILEFLAYQLLNILSSRKIYMNQIYNCFKKFKEDAKVISNTITDLKYIVEELPMAKEMYFTEDLKKLRSDLINEATKMQMKVKSLMADVDNDSAIWGTCIHQIENLERDWGLFLSSKDESIVNLNEMKRFETSLKEICAKADAIVILKDGRREILLETSTNFESLIKNFVKFLIITEMLTAVSEGDEKK